MSKNNKKNAPFFFRKTQQKNSPKINANNHLF